MNQRRRVALIFIGLVTIGCIVFSTVALVVLVRTMQADMDSRLATLARGVGQIVDVRRGKLRMSKNDVVQVGRLHGPGEHIAVIDRNGKLFFGQRPPAADRRNGYRFGSTTMIQRPGNGLVVAWQSDAAIAVLARTSALAFAAVTLILVLAAALVAHAMGGAIDRLVTTLENERRFVADASHELRTPLAVIRAETDLALRRPRASAEYVDALRSIDGEVTRLELLVDDLLDTMRDRSIVPRVPIDVAAIVTRTVERMRTTVREIKVAAAGDAPSVRGHEESIERAFTTVLHNAATHGGGAIDVRIVTERSRVRIEVADDGPGFAPEALKHASERFWRADSARSRGGTGLGLSIARVLVEAHGGSLELANGRERGAVVSLLLPCES